MIRFAALSCSAITAAIVGTASFQPPASLFLPTHSSSSNTAQQPSLLSVFSSASSSSRIIRHHKTTLLRCSSTHNSDSSSSSTATTHDDHNDAQYQLEQKTWMFRDKYPISYEVASIVDGATTNNNSDDDDVITTTATTVPILLLNGFGVGSFHQHRLMRQLLIEQQQQQQQQPQTRQNRYVIYGIDYLGQGKSWPINPQDGNSPDEYQLGYSADTWLEQLASFVQEVILSSSSTANDDDSTTTTTTTNNSSKQKSIHNTKVHLVGNSVGGYLATILTHRHPSLISSLTLLNATPVWGLNLPGWDGKLPAPSIPKAIGRQLFDVIRNENVILQYLETAYVRREAFDGTFLDSFDGWGCKCRCIGTTTTNDDDDDDGLLLEQGRGGESLGVKIRGCTEGNGGHAAFASILWSAPASGISFYDALQQVPVDVLLLFGGDDPWCTQAVGKRMHVTLASREEKRRRSSGDDDDDAAAPAAQRFVVLENVGHCPNHEAPSAVASVLIPWLNANDSEERSVVRLDAQGEIQEPWGEVLIREVSIEESKSLGFVDRVVSAMVG